jgi:hypothetical protein
MNTNEVIEYLQNAVKTTPYSIEKQRLNIAIIEIKKLTNEIECLKSTNGNF